MLLDTTNSRLRINLVLGHQLPFPPSHGGGVNNLLWMLSRQFAGMGHLVSVCSPLAEGLARDEVDKFGIRHRRFVGARMRRDVWPNNLSGIPYTLQLWNNLPEADITSFHAPFSFVLRHRKHLGVTTHTIHRTPKWIVRLYRNMDRIYAGSNATLREACAIAPHVAPRMKAIYNCVETNHVPPVPKPSHGGPLSLLYVGRFASDKGLQSLIGGGIDAIRSGCDITITTIGPQHDEEGGDSEFFMRINHMVGESGVGGRIRFLPNMADRSRLFSQIDDHDVFCLPSVSGETLNMAGLEAMSRAKPLMASDYGPNIEMLVDGETGLIVRAGDRVEWAKAIGSICKIKERLPSMGAASWRKARKEFSVEAIASEYVNDFMCLLSERAARLR